MVTDCKYNCEFLLGGSLPMIDKPQNGFIKLGIYQSSATHPVLFGLINCETGEIAIPFEYDDLGDCHIDVGCHTTIFLLCLYEKKEDKRKLHWTTFGAFATVAGGERAAKPATRRTIRGDARTATGHGAEDGK